MQVTRVRTHGFSFLELVIVITVGLLLVAIGVPNMLIVIANARLRGNIASLSGIFQACRMNAVSSNKTMTTRFENNTTGIKAYLKPATDSSAAQARDIQVSLAAPIIRLTAPTGPGAPSPIDTGTLGFTPQTGDASFNTRGLPCAYSGGTCDNYGFIYYFKDQRQSGSEGWAAVSISPAGRIKKWFWHGSSWGE